MENQFSSSPSPQIIVNNKSNTNLITGLLQFRFYFILKEVMGQIQSYGDFNSTILDMKLVDQKLRLYRNQANGKQYIKISALMMRPEDVEYERDLFVFRRVHEKYLVSADFYQIKEKKELICSEAHTVSYYVEYAEKRLFDFLEMPFQNGVKILSKALSGFELLYEKFGYFKVNPRMVMFNSSKQCKVWVSDDYSSPKYQFAQKILNKSVENKLVRQIVHMFDMLRDRNASHLSYTQFISNNTYLSFQQTISIFQNLKVNPAPVQVQIHAPQPCNVKNMYPPLPRVKGYVLPSPHPMNKVRGREFSSRPLAQTTSSSPVKGFGNVAVGNRAYPPSNQGLIKIEGGSAYQTAATSPDAKTLTQEVKNSLKKVNPHLISNSNQFSSTEPNSTSKSKINFNENKMKKKSSKHQIAPETIKKEQKQNKNKSIFNLKLHPNNNSISIEGCQSDCQSSQHNYQLNRPKDQQNRLKVNQITYDLHRSCEQESRAINNNFCSSITENNQKDNGQHHRRNQTDIFPDKAQKNQMNYSNPTDPNLIIKNSGQSSQKRSFVTDGRIQKQLTCLNTIKSIHVLDSQSELDQQILIDLAQIISKYRNNRSS